MDKQLQGDKYLKMNDTRIVNTSTLGLVGFGMTTILLNLHNAEITELNATITAMGLALGGAAQIVAGILGLINKALFSGTAFVAYGFFWCSLVLIWVNPFGTSVNASTPIEIGYYLILWAIFTGFMFIASLSHTRITQSIFLSLTILFVLLAVADFTGNADIKIIAGYVGILCGGIAMYDGLAQLVNAEHGKKILPFV